MNLILTFFVYVIIYEEHLNNPLQIINRFQEPTAINERHVLC